jgi:hypothetical protein
MSFSQEAVSCLGVGRRRDCVFPILLVPTSGLESTSICHGRLLFNPCRVFAQLSQAMVDITEHEKAENGSGDTGTESSVQLSVRHPGVR